jgi:hypothetical protein
MPSKPTNTVKTPQVKEVGTKEKSHINAITLFSAVILAIIVVTFIGAPVVQNLQRASNYTFGSFDGLPIEYTPGNYFAQQVEQLSRYYQDQFKNANFQMEKQLVWRQAFENAAQQVALKDLATKGGIIVTNHAIDLSLINLPEFQKDGQFSTELFNSTPPDRMLNYRKEASSELLIREYVGDRIYGGMVSDADVAFIQKMAYPQKKFSFVVYSEKDFPDAQVLAYAQKNQKLFRSIDLSRITVESQGDAERVRDLALKGTQSFADLAKTYSKDSLAQTGGALNTMLYHDLQSEFSTPADLDKVFTLKKGDLSPIFQKGKEWTIYKVVTPSTEPDFTKSSTLDDVRSYIKNNDRGVLEDYLMAQAKNFSQEAVSTSFAQEAKKDSRTLETTDFTSLNFDNLSLFPSISKASKNPAFQNLAANEDFFKKAFALPKGSVSQPILASPYVLVLEVADVRDSAPPPAKGTKIALPTPEISRDQVVQMADRDRSQTLQQDLLNTPLFQDHFNATFSQLR